MNRFGKKAVSISLACILGVGCIFSLPATTHAGFGLKDVTGIFGGKKNTSEPKKPKTPKVKIPKEVISQDKIEKVAGLALGTTSIEGLTGRQNKMLSNLSRSTVLMLMSVNEMDKAFNLGLQTQNSEGAKAAMHSAVASGNSGEMLNFSRGVMSSFKDKEKCENIKKLIEEGCKSALASGDEEKLKKLDSAIKNARIEKAASDAFVAASAIDLIKIAKDATAGLKGQVELATQYQQILDTTKYAKEVMNMRGAVSKMLKVSTDNYSKTRKLEKPSKAAIKAAQNSVEKG